MIIDEIYKLWKQDAKSDPADLLASMLNVSSDISVISDLFTDAINDDADFAVKPETAREIYDLLTTADATAAEKIDIATRHAMERLSK